MAQSKDTVHGRFLRPHTDAAVELVVRESRSFDWLQRLADECSFDFWFKRLGRKQVLRQWKYSQPARRISSKWYLFGSDGSMKTGLQLGGKSKPTCYYASNAGRASTVSNTSAASGSDRAKTPGAMKTGFSGYQISTKLAATLQTAKCNMASNASEASGTCSARTLAK